MASGMKEILSVVELVAILIAFSTSIITLLSENIQRFIFTSEVTLEESSMVRFQERSIDILEDCAPKPI